MEITTADAAAAADRNDRVIVTFEVHVAGVSIPITGRDTSSVWLVDNVWIVSRGAFCNAMAQLEINCPPVGEQTVESGWVEPYAGYVPPVHPDTPPPAWERGEDISFVMDVVETPRLTGPDRVPVAEWLASVGGTVFEYNQWLLFNMKWALDYLGADPVCIANEYRARVVASNAAVTGPGQLEPRELRDQYGWQNCATVIDPFIDGVERPDGRANDVGLRLSDTGLTLAERCRAVLPADVQLDKEWRPSGPQQGFYFELGHAGCDAWADWAATHHCCQVRAPKCHDSAHLAEEWLEHHIGLPENYPRVSC